ncbi:MAG: hypothetical protein ACE37E_15045 [Hyphomicrobiales bacterium]
MPTLLGAAIVALGGIVLMRVARREWKRVNQNLEAQRSAPRERKSAQLLEKDEATGTYRPADEN